MARNQEQNEKMRLERQEQILAAALREFSAKGLYATKIKDIAASVGMAQGLVYHYFKSKEDIFAELVTNALDKMNSAVGELEKMPLPPHDKIKAAIKQLLYTIEASDRFNQTCCLINQAINSTALPANVKEIIDQKRDIPYQVLAKIIEEGQREGTVVAGDPRALAMVFWTSINGLAIYKATRQADVSLPDADILINMFVKENDYGNT